MTGTYNESFGQHLLRDKDGKPSGTMGLAQRPPEDTVQDKFRYPLRELMAVAKINLVGGQFKGSDIGGLDEATKNQVVTFVRNALLAAKLDEKEFQIPVHAQAGKFTVNTPVVTMEASDDRIASTIAALDYAKQGKDIPASVWEPRTSNWAPNGTSYADYNPDGGFTLNEKKAFNMREKTILERVHESKFKDPRENER